MIELRVIIEEVRPGVLMLVLKSTEANPTEAEMEAANRVSQHIQAGLDEEQRRMGELGWSEGIEAPADVLTDEAIEAAKQKHMAKPPFQRGQL